MITSFTLALVLSGAAIILLSIPTGLKMTKETSEGLRRKWYAVIALMVFFLLGYLIFSAILLSNMSFPYETVAGIIFFGGACFVYLVIRLARATILRKSLQDSEIKQYAEQLAENLSRLSETNEELEKEIARRRISEEALRTSEQKYSSLVESTEDSIYLIDRDYRYLFINKKHLLRIGVSEGQYIEKGYGDFHTPDVTAGFTKIVDDVFRTGKSVQHEHKSGRDNEYFLLTLSPVAEPDGKIIAVTVVSKKITPLKRMEEELRALSLTDPLTGLYNRRGFMTLAEQHLKIANRLRNKLFMLYADLDGLKIINDTFGHQEGDRVLAEAASILRETFRESDIIARIGGDEFVVMPVGTTQAEVEAITDRLQKRLKARNDVNQNYRLSISFGVSQYDPGNPCSIDELLSRGDTEMYEQKKLKQKS